MMFSKLRWYLQLLLNRATIGYITSVQCPGKCFPNQNPLVMFTVMFRQSLTSTLNQVVHICKANQGLKQYVEHPEGELSPQHYES